MCYSNIKFIQWELWASARTSSTCGNPNDPINLLSFIRSHSAQGVFTGHRNSSSFSDLQLTVTHLHGSIHTTCGPTTVLGISVAQKHGTYAGKPAVMSTGALCGAYYSLTSWSIFCGNNSRSVLHFLRKEAITCFHLLCTPNLNNP